MRALLALLCALPCAAQDGVTVFTAGTVHPVSSPPIENGIVVVAGGKIRDVGGPDTRVPDGARVIDCAGRVLTPGLVDAATTLGVDREDANEQGDEVTPQMRILDAVDPTDKAFERARRAGVTTVQVSPGNRNVIGGLGAVLKTRGDTVAEMLLRDETCLRVTLGSEPSRGNRAIRGGTPASMYYRRPTTRMGVVWEIRKAFYDALAYRERKTVGDGAGPRRDAALEVLVRALERKLQVRTTARAEQDIRTALRLAAEFGYETVVEEATEAFRCVDAVAGADVKVVYSAPSAAAGHGDDAEGRLHTLALLQEKRIPFAIATGSHPGALDLLHEAMFAVRHGLDRERALAAITRVPAEILGVADRVGTLEPGKDADLVIWTGDPFDPTSRAASVFINGQEVE